MPRLNCTGALSGACRQRRKRLLRLTAVPRQGRNLVAVDVLPAVAGLHRQELLSPVKLAGQAQRRGGQQTVRRIVRAVRPLRQCRKVYRVGRPVAQGGRLARQQRMQVAHQLRIVPQAKGKRHGRLLLRDQRRPFRRRRPLRLRRRIQAADHRDGVFPRQERIDRLHRHGVVRDGLAGRLCVAQALRVSIDLPVQKLREQVRDRQRGRPACGFIRAGHGSSPLNVLMEEYPASGLPANASSCKTCAGSPRGWRDFFSQKGHGSLTSPQCPSRDR